MGSKDGTVLSSRGPKCSAATLYDTQPEMQALYQKMGEALQATGRPIIYSLCQYGLFDVGMWGRKVSGNLWRTGGDIQDNWKSMSENGFDKNGSPSNEGPGGWNDPDNLQIGKGGMTTEEYRTEMTLWSIMAAPVFIELRGNDLSKLTPAIKEILLNKEVIAVDQDRLGKQGHKVLQQGSSEIWSKPLSDGATAVALFNRRQTQLKIVVRWTDLDLEHVQRCRDLWGKTELRHCAQGYEATVPAHGAGLLRVTSTP
jgi:alpha-galactosidase